MSARRERGRLLVQRPPPEGWRSGWSPSAPVRRCACGARIIARSGAFVRCERGCLHLPRGPAPSALPPKVDPAAEAQRQRYEGLRRDIRLLEVGFVQDVRKGRRPSARAVALALEAVERLKEAFPDRASETERAFRWLARQRAAREAATA